MISDTPMLELTIDGQAIRVPAGTSIWEAARSAGIDIPALCHDPDLEPVGVCRMCVVDVGERVLAAGCVRECAEGMTVQTDSQAVNDHRRQLTRLLLTEHPTPCERQRRTGDNSQTAAVRRILLCRFGGAVFGTVVDQNDGEAPALAPER